MGKEAFMACCSADEVNQCQAMGVDFDQLLAIIQKYGLQLQTVLALARKYGPTVIHMIEDFASLFGKLPV